MRELSGDLWQVACDARCITTNGTVKKNGDAVMGRGVAQQAYLQDRARATRLGTSLQVVGNHLVLLEQGPPCLVTFPVKHHWYEDADPLLIVRSADELRWMTDALGWQTVVLPRPGCGNGKLAWAVVAPLLARLLVDDRFVIVERRA